jgi:hypothetical protein
MAKIAFQKSKRRRRSNAVAKGFEGRERLRRRMLALPQATKNEIRVAIRKKSDELVLMMKRLAPKDDGDLIEAIHWTPGARGADDPTMATTVRAGNKRVRYAHLVEFGSRPHVQGGRFKGTMHPGYAPQPFFFPAYRALRKRIRSAIRLATRRAIAASRRG